MPYVSVSANFYIKKIKTEEVRGLVRESVVFNKNNTGKPYEIAMLLAETYLEYHQWLSDEEFAEQLRLFKECASTLQVTVKGEADAIQES